MENVPSVISKRKKSARIPGRFLTHGQISILSQDRELRQVEFSVTLPACVMQAVTPQLLGAGLIDEYEIRSPYAVWVPRISVDGFRPGLADDIPSQVNNSAVQIIKNLFDFFGSAVSFLKFPGDLIPILPMGTYVKFRLRCNIDKLLPAIESMGAQAGVAELKYAFSEVSASLLSEWESLG